MKQEDEGDTNVIIPQEPKMMKCTRCGKMFVGFDDEKRWMMAFEHHLSTGCLEHDKT